MSRICWRLFTAWIFIILPACSPSAGGKPAIDQPDRSSAGTVKTILPATATTQPTRELPTDTGNGVIAVRRSTSIGEQLTGGIFSNSVDGDIPITIAYSKKNLVWEVKGSTIGTASVEYEAPKPKAKCNGAYVVEFTLSGTLVPANAMKADPPEGCYMVIYINEHWGDFDGTCSVPGRTLENIFPQEDHLYFGPHQLALKKGEQTGKFENGIDYTWRIEDIEVPISTNCAIIEDSGAPAGKKKGK